MNDIHIDTYKLKSGTRYSYRFEVSSVDGKRQWETKKGFRTKSEAKAAAQAAQLQYAQYGVVITQDTITFSEFVDKWMENECLVTLKQNTVQGYKKIVRRYILPVLGKYQLNAISREMLQRLITSLYDDGFSFNTLTNVRGILSKCFYHAVDNRYLVVSPAVRLLIPKNRVPKVETRLRPHILVPKEKMEQIFERFPEGHSSHLPLKIGYECGLRKGEAFALTWEDIDFEQKTLTVNRQIQWHDDSYRTAAQKKKENGSRNAGNGYWYFAAPKYDSYRTIDLSDDIVELLKREKARQQKAESEMGNDYTRYYSERPLSFSIGKSKLPMLPNPIGAVGAECVHFIFVRDNGSYISERTMQHVCQVVHDSILSGFDYHSLRHTHCSMLLEQGAEAKYVQDRLGHKNITTTLNIYQHLTNPMRARGQALLNQIYM